jgi:hypothetical protein
LHPALEVVATGGEQLLPRPLDLRLVGLARAARRLLGGVAGGDLLAGDVGAARCEGVAEAGEALAFL